MTKGKRREKRLAIFFCF